jgi:hypothetical protein
VEDPSPHECISSSEQQRQQKSRRLHFGFEFLLHSFSIQIIHFSDGEPERDLPRREMKLHGIIMMHDASGNRNVQSRVSE